MKSQLNSIVILVISLSYLFGQGEDVAYIRYFKNDHNFLSNLSMLSTSRRGESHLAVSYNENNFPLKIEKYSQKGSLEKRELLKYNKNGQLIERGEYNDQGEYLRLTVIGDSEPWGKEYRTWRYPVNEPLTFTDQRTHFTLGDGEHVSKILFETIDGQKYGQIELDYDYLGSLAEERWRELPSGRIIRRFKYKFDIMAEVVQIWEFGKEEQMISNVAINQAPADELYKVPPSRTHNTLDEIEIIAKEIEENRILIPHGGVIPKTFWDELIIVNGDRLMIDFVELTDNGVQFRLESEEDILTIPIHRVHSLTSRMGDVIYPKPI